MIQYSSDSLIRPVYIQDNSPPLVRPLPPKPTPLINIYTG